MAAGSTCSFFLARINAQLREHFLRGLNWPDLFALAEAMDEACVAVRMYDTILGTHPAQMGSSELADADRVRPTENDMKMKPGENRAVQNSVQRSLRRREDAAGARLQDRGGAVGRQAGGLSLNWSLLRHGLTLSGLARDKRRDIHAGVGGCAVRRVRNE